MFFIFLCCSDLDDDKKTHITELYQQLMPDLVKYSKTRLNDKSYAEDIVQLSFIILIKKYNSLKTNDLNRWLILVVDNLAKNQNKVDKKRKFIVPTINVGDLNDEGTSYYELTSRVEEIILNELSETEADFFNTYFILRESHEKAAEKYNITINASKARKCRIKARIIRILKEHDII